MSTRPEFVFKAVGEALNDEDVDDVLDALVNHLCRLLLSVDAPFEDNLAALVKDMRDCAALNHNYTGIGAVVGVKPN